MIVRPFLSAEAPAVNAVALAAFAPFERVYNEWETLTRSVGAMADLASAGEIVVAADESGRILGAVAYFGPLAQPRADFFAPHWTIVRMLVVDPAARGHGIGRRLTEEGIARARRDGAGAIALHTSPAMETALAMYLRMGFRLERRVPDRFGVPYGLSLKDLSTGGGWVHADADP